MDYKKLNNIIIKNKYLLPNANEFWDQFNKAKIFIKLNIKRVYNLIYIKKKKNRKQLFKFNIIYINIVLYYLD